MSIFEYFNWQDFLRNLIACLGMGVIASTSIALNLRLQNKLKSDSSVFSNFLQLVSYLFSLGFTTVAILWISVNFIDFNDASGLETAIYFAGTLLPFILAFRSGFIPKTR